MCQKSHHGSYSVSFLIKETLQKLRLFENEFKMLLWYLDLHFVLDLKWFCHFWHLGGKWPRVSPPLQFSPLLINMNMFWVHHWIYVFLKPNASSSPQGQKNKDELHILHIYLHNQWMNGASVMVFWSWARKKSDNRWSEALRFGNKLWKLENKWAHACVFNQ